MGKIPLQRVPSSIPGQGVRVFKGLWQMVPNVNNSGVIRPPLVSFPVKCVCVWGGGGGGGGGGQNAPLKEMFLSLSRNCPV